MAEKFATEAPALQAGDDVPEFQATTVDGRVVAYADLWQRRNLLLVCVGRQPAPGSHDYVAMLTHAARELTAHDTECVVTTDEIARVPSPGVLLADRWGEIHFIAAARTAAELPGPGDLIEWLRYVQSQCPECQGEYR